MSDKSGRRIAKLLGEQRNITGKGPGARSSVQGILRRSNAMDQALADHVGLYDDEIAMLPSELAAAVQENRPGAHLQAIQYLLRQSAPPPPPMVERTPTPVQKAAQRELQKLGGYPKNRQEMMRLITEGETPSSRSVDAAMTERINSIYDRPANPGNNVLMAAEPLRFVQDERMNDLLMRLARYSAMAATAAGAGYGAYRLGSTAMGGYDKMTPESNHGRRNFITDR